MPLIALLLSYRWWIIGTLWISSICFTAYKVWDLTSTSCEVSALTATVNDQEVLNEIRNHRPDRPQLDNRLRKGTF